MSNLFFVLCFACFLGEITYPRFLLAADGPGPSVSSPVIECKTTISKLRRAIERVKDFAMVVSLVGFISIGGVHVYHESEALAQGKEHIGSAIYLGLEGILSRLPEDIQTLTKLKNRTKEDDIKILKALTDILYGDYDDTARPAEFFPRSRDASSYCKGAGTKRGVCRQKAEVLVATANKLGISGVVEVSLWKGAHAWGWFPRLGLVGDPTSGRVSSRRDFYEHQREIGSDLDKQWVGSWAYNLNRILGGIVR